MSQPGDGVFRDGSDGARARREYLLEKRRHEYAVLSHHVRAIFVRRVARTAAGATAAAGGLVITAGASASGHYQFLTRLIPGPEPAPLVTVLFATLVAAFTVYFVFRSVAEDYYARVISRTAQASDDLYGDLQRLERVRPELVAHRLADRMAFSSLLGPLLGACLLGPYTALYTLVALVENNLHVPTEFDGILVRHISPMWPALLLLVALAVLGARRLRAQRVTLHPSIRWSSSPFFYVACLTALCGSWLYYDYEAEKVAVVLVAAAAIGVTVFGSWVSARLSIERVALAQLFERARPGAPGQSLR